MKKSEEKEIIYHAAATPWINGKSWNVKSLYAKVSPHHRRMQCLLCRLLHNTLFSLKFRKYLTK